MMTAAMITTTRGQFGGDGISWRGVTCDGVASGGGATVTVRSGVGDGVVGMMVGSWREGLVGGGAGCGVVGAGVAVSGVVVGAGTGVGVRVGVTGGGSCAMIANPVKWLTLAVMAFAAVSTLPPGGTNCGAAAAGRPK